MDLRPATEKRTLKTGPSQRSEWVGHASMQPTEEACILHPAQAFVIPYPSKIQELSAETTVRASMSLPQPSVFFHDSRPLLLV